jgi:hypothetical protein
MISLPIQTNLADLELFIQKVRQSPGQDLRVPLQVNRGGSFGFPAVAVQAVATWARLHEGIRRLRVTPTFVEDENTRSRLAGSLLGMTGLYFAHEVLSGEKVIPRSIALESVAPRVFAMEDYRYRDTLRGRNVALCCFEGAKLEFVKSLYAMPRRGDATASWVRPAAEFKAILANMLEACASGSSRNLSELQLEVLAQLVHQLFKNADVHATSDVQGSLYDAGVRGVQVREVVIGDEEAFSDFVAGDRAFESYLTKLNRRPLLRENDKHGKKAHLGQWKSSTFIEVTVFDTGPGLALRWLSNQSGVTQYSQIDKATELRAINECFHLHATTHSTANRGDGLPIALRAMAQLQAFMFLRTGRLALFQDFSSGEHVGFSPRPRYGSQRTLGEAAGATYSICFPMPR